MRGDPIDPKEVIREAYRIDGITPAECRSIFLDWALSLGADQPMQAAIAALLMRYGADHPDHPMTAVLMAGQEQGIPPRRRGGWRSRPRD